MSSSASSEDVTMHSASQMLSSVVPSRHQGSLNVPAPPPSAPPTRSVSPMIVDDRSVAEEPVSKPSLDLLDRIHGMYRLLDLVTEQGSNGLVDKILIDQDSISQFANQIQPGSYRSEIQVDFRALDERKIKPKGVYGSIPAIVQFLSQLGSIDAETRSLLLKPRDDYSGVSRPTLRSGLYALQGSKEDFDLFFIIFWPEDGTWVDGTISSVSRNRVTFMRYLTKLCEQVVCLISDEHASHLVWKDSNQPPAEGEEFEEFDDRIAGFFVEQTNEEEETARVEEGFSLRHSCIEEITRRPPGYPADFELPMLQSQLLAGETSQAILRPTFIPEEVKSMPVDDSFKPLALIDRLSVKMSHRITFDRVIDKESLKILLDKGNLWERCGRLKDEWNAQLSHETAKSQNDRQAERTRLRTEASESREMLAKNIGVWIAQRAAMHYHIVLERELFQSTMGTEEVEEEHCTMAIAAVNSWLDQHDDVKLKIEKELLKSLSNLESNSSALYSRYKRQLIRVLAITNSEDGSALSEEEMQRLVELITIDKHFDEKVTELIGPSSKKEPKLAWYNPVPLISYAYSELVGDNATRTRSTTYAKAARNQPTDTIPILPQQDDIIFAQYLETLKDERPGFAPAVEQFKPILLELLKQKVKKLISTLPGKAEQILQETIDKTLSEKYDKRKKNEDLVAWQSLKERVEQCIQSSTPEQGNGVTLNINSIKRESSKFGQQESFRLRGTLRIPTQAGIQYSLRPLDIHSNDQTALSVNADHVCKPAIRQHIPPPFFVPLHNRLRYVRPLEKDRCLVIIEDRKSLQVYLEQVNSLAASIYSEKCVKKFLVEKIGKQCLFAVDEVKKLLVIASTVMGAVNLHVYQYDPDTRAIGARGSAIPITKWYQHVVPVLVHMTFVSGSEEVLLAEEGGRCRIFSLVTEGFRPSKLQATGDIQGAFSSSDGACLFLQVSSPDGPRILCHHWASFGSSPGVVIAWPRGVAFDAQMRVSSVGLRTNTHTIFVDRTHNLCTSLHVLITRKSSEFAFRSTNAGQAGSEHVKETTNNSLIDCHAEVWTRYPVLAPIHRETNASAIHYPRSVTFVSSAPPAAFAPYFTLLVREFEQKTRKPTRGILGQITVSGVDRWDPSTPDAAVSELQAGDWLVGLFCLIPIHLAVTGSNRFIPLKDGVISPEFEQSLLGANVAQISEAISFGWYESIFSSYLANKPVKVVTSMGEQSVGKSFALNHFVDTSFAGSAMRCTEGVWLSVTPTRDYLVVSMDFEGVHSIERSKQEDTLLVLLNCAISNLVLFRNNFALSRDIAGLFTSFQSCTKVLDPASNKSLFHSTLGIIIKDVIDSDTKEIINEFRQKFQSIVQQERSDNFISKLHRGRLDIIPWPVIESSRFYDLFGALKKKFDAQPVIHQHAGAFLSVLKMLMAKLKANDWGALDQNLAAQRSQQLHSVLRFALALGTTDPTTEEPLKNYDTDEKFKNEDTPAHFHVDGLPLERSLSLADCLKQLRMGWSDKTTRYEVGEQEFFRQHGAYLQGLAEARIKHVHMWLKANTSRFGEKAEITSLFRDFDSISKEIRRSILLCGSKCSNCGLLCLEHHQHSGVHNCMTSHRCPEPCGFDEQHEDGVPSCDLPAGHTGRHVCSGTPHLCGIACHLSGKSGCLGHCSKPMDHDEEEGHICAAGMHTCGEVCDLVQSDGTRLCDRPCVADCRLEHDVHKCDRALSCPVKCQLCNSYCAAGDHFHALEEGAIHLCGQEHPCPEECELPGICEIATTPQSIESTFVGRHEKFQYTKYSQEARRLQCVIPIAPDMLNHDGQHVHSTKENVFHYCEQRCTHCSYYCTLPLNHQQNEHDTSHGSMAQTEWVIEGDDDVVLELQGRKYAAGDSGAPMLCSLVCKSLGRHVHVDKCRLDEDGYCAGGEGVEHIPHAGNNLDWITHRLFWAKSGFKDPYPQTEQADFDLCDHRCGGEEHDPEINQGAIPSRCVLPLFHGRPSQAEAPPLGHISHDGHAYDCKNPVLMQRSFHIFFVLDKSGSMTLDDRQPLDDSPATQRITQIANNRFGAVISSLYAFWTARATAIRAGTAAGLRRDAYSIITFDTNASVEMVNDTTSDPDDLLELILSDANLWGGTNYTAAIETVQAQMEATWSTERSPVVIFLSDGECEIADETVYDLCRAAVKLGKPLAFHSVSFGEDDWSQSLRRMAAIAGEVYDGAPRDPLAPAGPAPCTFNAAIDTIQLASTFLSLAESLKNPRAALSRI